MVGLDLILADAGVTKTTFYNHFESKEDMILAAVDRRDSWEHARGGAVRQVAGSDEAAGPAAGNVRRAGRLVQRPELRRVHLHQRRRRIRRPAPPIHQLAAKHKRRRCATRSATWPGPARTNPETFADLYSTMVEGVMVLSQSTAGMMRCGGWPSRWWCSWWTSFFPVARASRP